MNSGQVRGHREGFHYRIDPDTGCWLWLLKIGKNGYPGSAYNRIAAHYGGRPCYFEVLA